MRGRITLAVILAAGSATSLQAQDLPGSSKEVSQFLRSTATVVALEDVRVIDGTGARPLDHQTIIIADGRIAAVGPNGKVPIPNGAERRRLSGYSVLPGLVMLHEHMMYFSGRRIWHSQPESYPRLYLAAGVTTARTAGTDFPAFDLNLKSAIDDGRIAGPRMFVTGPFLNGYEGHFLGDTIVRNEAEARQTVGYWADRGATSIKLYAGLSPEAGKGAITEAHARGLKVTGHLGRIGCRQAIELGIDNIEHSFLACLSEMGGNSGDDGKPVAPPDVAKAKALMTLMVDRNVVLTITPRDWDRTLSDEERMALHPTSLANYEAERARGWPPSAAAEPILRKLEREFMAAGGKVVVGADAENFGQIAGFANRRAVELLVEGGTPPLEAIRIATLGGAQFLGIDQETGTVAAGKLADLLVVRGDPSNDIKDIRQVDSIYRAGKGYDPTKLRKSVEGLVGWR